MKKIIADIKLFRKIFFPIFSKINFEITIKHDVTNRKLSILTWDHKGYWYYGREREKSELSMFKRLINEGDNVLEVGGHIGYVTQVFEDLVGDQGRVFVAEPTPKSRFYLKKNVRSNTKVLPIALADINGEMDFFTEKFGGFTNSLISDFTKKSNKSLANTQVSVAEDSIKKISVEVRTIDTICDEYDIKPDFLKIDVEGAELSVLKGAQKTLKNVQSLMVEVSENKEKIVKILKAYNFKAFDSKGENISNSVPDDNQNIFFYKT
tara:strand:- start:603 stop:1397 length:795 start_codon:yes stop_codon:yes gene_type:complete